MGRFLKKIQEKLRSNPLPPSARHFYYFCPFSGCHKCNFEPSKVWPWLITSNPPKLNGKFFFSQMFWSLFLSNHKLIKKTSKFFRLQPNISITDFQIIQQSSHDSRARKTSAVETKKSFKNIQCKNIRY